MRLEKSAIHGVQGSLIDLGTVPTTGIHFMVLVDPLVPPKGQFLLVLVGDSSFLRNTSFQGL